MTTAARRLDLAAIAALTFERPDLGRFPALRVAMAALQQGGSMPTVLNAANEVAVEFFLAGRIGFMDIARAVEQCCETALRQKDSATPDTVALALAIDHISRERTRAALS